MLLPRAPAGASRRYRPPQVFYVVSGGIAVALVFGIVLGVTEHAAAVFLAIIAVSAIFSVWQGASAITTAGVYETPYGIEFPRLFYGTGYHRVAWADIKEFRAGRTRVFALTRNGSPVELKGIVQGSRIPWNGGETEDIVRVLNERLEAWRSEHGHSA